MKKLNIRLITILAMTITTIIIVALLIANIIVGIKAGYNQTVIILLFTFVIVSLFVYGFVIVQIYLTRLGTVNSLVSSINSIESTQEELFGTGIIVFNEAQVISYITEWMIQEGFDKFLGKNVSSLKIDTEIVKRQEFEFASRKWEVVVSRKNRTLLFKDVTESESLKSFILEQNSAVLSTHISFSKKLSYNEAAKSQVSVTILQILQEWTSNINGIYSASTTAENTSIIIFRWKRGEKDILTETLLNKLKNELGKFSKDVTISMGVTYGKDEPSILLEKSLRANQLSKSRGGDQIVLEQPNGQTQYIGSSSVQTTSNTILNVKKFYTQFVLDMEHAREVFITAHKFADLDALGSALGILELIKDSNKDTWIVLDQFDTTSAKVYESLPKNIKDRIISQKEAISLKTNRTHIVIVDVSRPEATQASKLIETTQVEQISIVDHHRAGDQIVNFDEEKILIETSVSSASELIVEMLKIKYNSDAQGQIETNIATALLAGIQLDSKQLTKNVTNSTFDAVAFLLNNNASQATALELFKPAQELLTIEGNAFGNIQRPTKDTLFTFVDEKYAVRDEETSIIADKLLDYKDVDASFVLARTVDGRFKLSARSNDNVNVQLICESLGGGGHYNVAAASWKTNIQYNTVIKRVINAINKGVK